MTFNWFSCKYKLFVLPPTEQCTGLDPAWSQLTTEATFPVDEGTVLTVSCEEGFLLRGSNTITCTEGTTFSSATTPTCVELGEFQSSKSYI